MEILKLIYEHPWATGIFLLIIGMTIEAAIIAWKRNNNEDDEN